MTNSDEPSAQPLLCEGCPAPATKYLEIDSALDADTSENCGVYFCDLHSNALHLALNTCSRHIVVSTDTEPDRLPDGMTLIRIQNYNKADDENDALPDWYDAAIVCNECADAALRVIRTPEKH